MIKVMVKRAEEGMQWMHKTFNRYSKFGNCEIFLFLLIFPDHLVVKKSENKNTLWIFEKIEMHGELNAGV